MNKEKSEKLSKCEGIEEINEAIHSILHDIKVIHITILFMLVVIAVLVIIN